MVGTDNLFDALSKFFALSVELVGVYNNAHRVNSRGHMLGENRVIFKDLQKSSHKALAGVHSVLFNRNRREILLARDTGDEVL